MEKLNAGATQLGLQLSQGQLEQFAVYYRELVDWNKRVNLTAITDCLEVQTKHFLDSLTVTLAWQPGVGHNGPDVIDVGTGAGIPGLPLKIVFPGIRLVLLDATTKKADFLFHLRQKLGLGDVEIVVGRAEEVAHLGQHRGRFDIVLSRAVASLPSLVELTLPFCRVGGRFIAQKKGNIALEVGRAARAIEALGGKLREVKKVDMPEFTDERQLVVIDKIAVTPDRYPRRPGIPAKRPIT